MRLPNGYGSVVKLSGRRRKPYMVRTAVHSYDDKGHPKFDIIGYADSRENGLIMLSSYNKDPWDIDRAKVTLAELHTLWLEKRAPKLGKGNKTAMRSAYKHVRTLVDLPYKDIKAYQMQDTIDDCGHGYSTQHKIKTLWWHLDNFALELGVVRDRFSTLLKTASAPQFTSRERLTDEEIAAVWAHEGTPCVDIPIILMLSGWRIGELLAMRKADVNLVTGTMTGGSKTAAGKGRIVPIHTAIRPIVERRMAEPGEYLIDNSGKRMSDTVFRKKWQETKAIIGVEKNPHEYRHTFRSLLDDSEANRKCIDMMMGHVSGDVGTRVYTHKVVKDLINAVEKIDLAKILDANKTELVTNK